MQLVFIEPGIKINGAYNCDVLLAQHLLPAIQEISGDFFIFQQGSAPAHRAKETVQFLSYATPDFITPLLQPPNSLDLKTVDYNVWSDLTHFNTILTFLILTPFACNFHNFPTWQRHFLSPKFKARCLRNQTTNLFEIWLAYFRVYFAHICEIL
jgi:hypothetical protein